jgi:hypothetical protein
MARRIRPNTDGVEDLYTDVFRDGDRENYSLDYALAWLERVDSTPIPKRCSAKTRREIERTLYRAFHLQRRAVVDEIIERMRKADELQATRDGSYQYCGTRGLAGVYELYRRVMGPQNLTFRDYIEAAVVASLESYWNDKDRVAVVSVVGNTKMRLKLLIDYIGRLGFDVDIARNSNGAPVLTLDNVNLNKAPRSKQGKSP